MAERITSVFGNYADRLQTMIDLNLSRFDRVWFDRYFDMAVPAPTLNFTTVIGRSRIEAAASIVDRNTPAPLRSRPALEKLQGEVPAIMEKIKMTESDYRNYLTVQNLNLADSTKKAQLLDLLFNDIKRVGTSVFKRLDMLVLQGLRYGLVNVTVTNNPDALVTGDIDLLMSANNKKFCSVVWSAANAATMKPITDINSVVKAAKAKGVTFEKILMNLTDFWAMASATETLTYMLGFYNLPSSAKVMPTIDKINDMLRGMRLPVIEIVDVQIGVEKDGVISASEPFAAGGLTFVPSGKLGVIHNAVAIEELSPAKQVSYAKYRNALISKWSETDPFAEWTKAELNAFPGFEAIDSIYLLNVAATA